MFEDCIWNLIQSNETFRKWKNLFNKSFSICKILYLHIFVLNEGKNVHKIYFFFTINSEFSDNGNKNYIYLSLMKTSFKTIILIEFLSLK